MGSGISRPSSNSVGRKSSLDSLADDNVESNVKEAPAETEKISSEDVIVNSNEAASDTEERKQEEGCMQGFPDEEPPKKRRNPIVSFSKSTLGGSDVR